MFRKKGNILPKNRVNSYMLGVTHIPNIITAENQVEIQGGGSQIDVAIGPFLRQVHSKILKV